MDITEGIFDTKYSRMDQVNLWKTAFKKVYLVIVEYIVFFDVISQHAFTC